MLPEAQNKPPTWAEQAVAWGWRELFLTVGTLLAGSLGILVGLQVVVQVGNQPTGITSPPVYAAMVLIYSLIVLAIYLFVARRHGWASLGWRPVSGRMLLLVPLFLLLGLFGMALINALLAAVLGSFENPQAAALTGGEPLSTLELLLVLPLVAGLVPVAEELLFRGLFYGVLHKHGGTSAAVLGSGLLFALVHFILILFPALLLLGLLLGYLRARSHSVLPGILLHMVQNALALVSINALLGGG